MRYLLIKSHNFLHIWTFKLQSFTITNEHRFLFTPTTLLSKLESVTFVPATPTRKINENDVSFNYIFKYYLEMRRDTLIYIETIFERY